MAKSIEASMFTWGKLRFEPAKESDERPNTGPDLFLAPIILKVRDPTKAPSLAVGK
jgi:hypothetical protein